MTPELTATLFWKVDPQNGIINVDNNGIIHVIDQEQLEGEDDIVYVYAFTTTKNDNVQDESWHRTTVNVK